MSNNELMPQGQNNDLVKSREENARKNREAFKARSSSDVYGAVGWLTGFFITLFVSTPLIWILTENASRSVYEKTLLGGIAIAWWFNPLSLGALGYIFSNLRAWRFRTLGAIFIWFLANILISASIYDDTARIMILNGFIILGYLLFGLWFLYIQLRVFMWAAAGRAGLFFIRILGWGALNAIAYLTLVDPAVRATVFSVFGFLLQISFLFFFIVIQYVGMFWFLGRSRVEVIRPGDPKQITFDDYKGQPNLLRLVRQWISLLSDRTQFQKMGGQFINGLLLYGEPGTGKTLLAKAMAGEAGIAFISIEGSGFQAMFIGLDVLKMIRFVSQARRLAREYGACIAYIDEIDAVGASRGNVMGGMMGGMGGMMGGMGAGRGALTRLLYEMDGISELTRWEKLRARWYQWRKKPVPPRDWHILFMGSTNRPDVLDPALTRPGRFDRTVVVNKPDRSGRREMIKYYLNKVLTDETVDVEAIVSDTAWATPARIMSAITKDAVRLAFFDGRDKVAQRDIELAFQEQAMGLENPIEEIEDDQRRQIAYHEAGHAVVQHHIRPDQRIVRVSIIRRSNALGYVLPVPNYDIYSVPLRTYLADILVAMAGHVATKLFLGEYWTGATSDFNSVRSRLWQLGHYGYFGPPLDRDDAGTKLMDKRNAVIEVFWNKMEEQTSKLLTRHAAEVHAVAKALLERNDLNGKECVEVIRSAANGVEPLDSENLLKELVEETIVNGSRNGVSDNGSKGNNGKSPSRKKTTTRPKVKTKS